MHPSINCTFSLVLLFTAASALAAPRPVTQLIVRYKDETSGLAHIAAVGERVQTLSQRGGVALAYRRAMSGQAHVLALPAGGLSRAEALALAARLRADPTVAYAEPDDWVTPAALPTDPYYVGSNAIGLPRGQWYFKDPAVALLGLTPVGAANFAPAWEAGTNGSGVTVALVDTGVVTHTDLSGQVVAGYDFVSDSFIANDGDGRDANASDPGDWVTSDDLLNPLCSGSAVDNSSWHGTHVAGLIGALANGSAGVGAARGAQVLNARAMGKCGGYTSDIIDAMRWSAGLAVSGVASNTAHIAKVINLSLGADGSCSLAFQSAIDDVRATGAVVVAAAGNTLGVVSQPANCNGVIAVTAHTYEGDNANYAGTGAQIALSAPGGGDCRQAAFCNFAALPSLDQERYLWSTGNFGLTTPTGEAMLGMAGTSAAVPHVAAAAALLLGLRPTLGPDDVRYYLTSSSRPHPAGSYCAINTGLCGSGLLDAHAAVVRLAGAPDVSVSASPLSVLASSGTTVNLSGSATAQPGGSGAFTYAWSQESGPAALNWSSGGATASLTAPTSAGVMVFRFTVTDGNGQQASATTAVTVSSPPSSGGGGALGGLGLMLLVVAGWLARRRD